MENQQYTGCTVNGKSTTVSYKVHKVIENPKEEYQIIPNTQEAIIDENVWLRVQELKLFSRIYEDNVIGKLSDERYTRMAAEYESEQKELLEKVKEEEQQLSEMEQKSVDMRLLLQGLREFTDMKELTPTIINKLIRRIEVHNPEKKHARKSVKVDIYFTAVGLVSLPDEQEIRKMMEQIRNASLLPKQLTA